MFYRVYTVPRCALPNSIRPSQTPRQGVTVEEWEKTSGPLGFLTTSCFSSLTWPWTCVAPKWVEVMESLHISSYLHEIYEPSKCGSARSAEKSHRSCVKRIMRCHCSGQSAWNLRRWIFLFHKFSQQKPSTEIWASQAFLGGGGWGLILRICQIRMWILEINAWQLGFWVSSLTFEIE